MDTHPPLNFLIEFGRITRTIFFNIGGGATAPSCPPLPAPLLPLCFLLKQIWRMANNFVTKVLSCERCVLPKMLQLFDSSMIQVKRNTRTKWYERTRGKTCTEVLKKMSNHNIWKETHWRLMCFTNWYSLFICVGIWDSPESLVSWIYFSWITACLFPCKYVNRLLKTMSCLLIEKSAWWL